jgi:hypothetical protein
MESKSCVLVWQKSKGGKFLVRIGIWNNQRSTLSFRSPHTRSKLGILINVLGDSKAMCDNSTGPYIPPRRT